MVQEIELENIYEEPQCMQKINEDTNRAEKRVCRLFVLSFGILCIIQASLNLSLRLTLYSSQSNTAHFSENKSGKLKELQESTNALSRDRDILENRIAELLNMMKTVEEERDRLKMKMRDTVSCVSSQRCPPGWKEINSRCYFLSTETKTWKDSRRDCHSKEADLVVINSEKEQRDIYRLDGINDLLCWIGLYGTNGSFKWVDGFGQIKQFWLDGKPQVGPNNCVVMNHEKPVLTSWINVSCGLKRRWLCEKDLCTNP